MKFLKELEIPLKFLLKLGYIHRVNDSLQNNSLKKVNSSNTYYLDSKWIQTKNTLLSLYANYRNFKSENNSSHSQKSINSDYSTAKNCK